VSLIGAGNALLASRVPLDVLRPRLVARRRGGDVEIISTSEILISIVCRLFGRAGA